MEEYRAIPGYEYYGVTRSGKIKSLVREIVLKQTTLDGYLTVSVFRGSPTETLPVHRAVALAWVINPNPEKFLLVNHLDGNRMNNLDSNLEWTDYSGNNYHAINNGLRSDNIFCRVRNFYTKEVVEFASMAQAAEHMGLSKDAPFSMIKPKKYGSLVNGKYEFRFASGDNPWFYENRETLVPPSRFMIKVLDSDGSVKEVYSNAVFLKEYRLYGSDSKSIPELIAYANKIHPDKLFTYRDSYYEEIIRVRRQTNKSVTQPIYAEKDGETLSFPSLTKAAEHFQVDRSSIVRRLDSSLDLNGWTLTSAARSSNATSNPL